MDLPVKVWAIIFSYLHPNDLIEISATCKLFNHLPRKNELYIRKMEDVKKLFKDYKDLSGCYYDLLVNFSYLTCLRLKKYGVNENNLRLAKSVIMNKLFYSILPFRVWNHLFLCERCQHSSWMCNFCTIMHIKHRGISDYINKNSYLQLNENIPSQLRQGIVKIYLYLYIQIFIEKDEVHWIGIIILVACFMKV